MTKFLLALLLFFPALGAHAQSRTIEFDVLREGNPIGTHRVTIATREDETQVEIAIDLAVRFAFVTVYRYTHRSREVWRAHRLVSLDAQTDDDGTRTQVRAQASDGALAVTGSGGDYAAPADTIPTSYWNRDKLARSRLLDTQSGKLIDVRATPISADANGGAWRLNGDLEADVAYGPAGEWSGLAFVTRGSRIVYVRRNNAAAVSR